MLITCQTDIRTRVGKPCANLVGRYSLHFSKLNKGLEYVNDMLAMAQFLCYQFFFQISEFSYKLIRFLLNKSIVESDNKIGKYS